MKLTTNTTIKEIEAIDILYSDYSDAVIKITYQIARDLQFLGYSYQRYRERTKMYEKRIGEEGFDILWNLAINYNKENYPCHMETLPEIQEVGFTLLETEDG